jgi:hypothetical protein
MPSPRVLKRACPFCARAVRVSRGRLAEHVPLGLGAALDAGDPCLGSGFTP